MLSLFGQYFTNESNIDVDHLKNRIYLAIDALHKIHCRSFEAQQILTFGIKKLKNLLSSCSCDGAESLYEHYIIGLPLLVWAMDDNKYKFNKFPDQALLNYQGKLSNEMRKAINNIVIDKGEFHAVIDKFEFRYSYLYFTQLPPSFLFKFSNSKEQIYLTIWEITKKILNNEIEINDHIIAYEDENIKKYFYSELMSIAKKYKLISNFTHEYTYCSMM